MNSFPKVKRCKAKDLGATLDAVFSEFIRLRDSDQYGYCRCITCGRAFYWKEIDAGHFVSRDRKVVGSCPKNLTTTCDTCFQRCSFAGQQGYTDTYLPDYDLPDPEKLEDTKVDLPESIDQFWQKKFKQKTVKTTKPLAVYRSAFLHRKMMFSRSGWLASKGKQKRRGH